MSSVSAADVGLLALRAGVGAVMIAHGFGVPRGKQPRRPQDTAEIAHDTHRVRSAASIQRDGVLAHLRAGPPRRLERHSLPAAAGLVAVVAPAFPAFIRPTRAPMPLCAFMSHADAPCAPPDRLRRTSWSYEPEALTNRPVEWDRRPRYIKSNQRMC
jgi:hypothetical protein